MQTTSRLFSIKTRGASAFCNGLRCTNSIVAEEPIEDMPDTIQTGLVEKLLDRYCDGTVSEVPAIHYTCGSPPNVLISRYID